MTEYKSKSPNARVNANLKGQCAAILAELVEARGEWVPLPQIMKHAAQYNARLFGLRKLGFKIENRTEVCEGVRHSWFRLVPPTLVPIGTEVHRESGAGDLFSRRHCSSSMLDHELGRRGGR